MTLLANLVFNFPRHLPQHGTGDGRLVRIIRPFSRKLKLESFGERRDLLLELAPEARRLRVTRGLPLTEPVEAPCTHEELAHLVGAHRETTTRILNEMRSRELIELRWGRVVLLNPAGLRELSADLAFI